VLDQFGSNGSILIAAEKSGRRVILLDLDRQFVEVIVMRWEQFTDKKAKRD